MLTTEVMITKIDEEEPKNKVEGAVRLSVPLGPVADFAFTGRLESACELLISTLRFLEYYRRGAHPR